MQQIDPRQFLETDTLLNKFQGQVVLITYDGIKQLEITKIEKYEIISADESVHKVDITFCLTPEAANNLGDALRVNKKLEAEKKRTDKDPNRRPRIIGKRPMRKLAQRYVKVTFLNGYILYGIPLEYNDYNFTMNVNDQMILVYRHAIYQFDIIRQKSKKQQTPKKMT